MASIGNMGYKAHSLYPSEIKEPFQVNVPDLSFASHENESISGLADRTSFSSVQLICLFLVFSAVAFCLHRPGFQAAMIYDSSAWIQGNAHIFATRDSFQIMGITPVRPLFMLSLYLNYLLGGMEPYWFRLANALILAGTGLVLVVLIAIVLDIPTVGVQATRETKQFISVFLGLFFVAHPLQIFAVLYIWQREAIQACLFYFLAMATYLGARSGRFKREGLGYLLFVIFFVLGLLCKENVATVPVVLLLAELILFRQGFRQLLVRGITLALLVLPPFVAYAFFTHSLHGPESTHAQGIVARLVGHYDFSGRTPLEVLLTECRVLFSYLRMIVAPSLDGVHLIRAEFVSKSFLNPPVTALACAGVFGLIAVACALMRKRPLTSFGILFFVVSLLPESLLIPPYLFFGYRAILPMFGVLLVAADALVFIISRFRNAIGDEALRPVALAALLIPLVYVGPATFSQARQWTPLQVWKSAADRLPVYSDNLEAVPYLDIVVNTTLELLNVGQYAAAEDLLLKAAGEDPKVATPANANSAAKPDRLLQAAERIAGSFKMNPERSSGALLNLGVLLGAKGRNEDSIAVYRKCIEINPHLIVAYHNLGNALEGANNLAAAIEVYAAAVEIAPRPAASFNSLAIAMRRAGYLPEAVEMFVRSIESDPNVPDVYKNLGEALEEYGNLPEAIEAYSSALQLNPNLNEVRFRLALALKNLGRLEEAAQQLKLFVEREAGSAQAYLELGYLQQNAGKHQEAIEYYTKATILDPRSLQGFNNLAAAWKSLGHLERAIENFRRAVDLKPTDVAALSNLGVALEESGRVEEAVELFRKAVGINPQRAVSYLNLGGALKKAGDRKRAIEQFSKAVRLQPGLARAHRNLARALEESGNRSLAVQHYERVTQLKPQSFEAEYDLANCLLKDGKIKEATERFRRAVALKPDFVDGLTGLATALLKQNHIEEAIVTLVKGLALNKESADLCNALGLAFAAMRKPRQAEAYFKKALTLDPSHSDAQKNLQLLATTNRQPLRTR